MHKLLTSIFTLLFILIFVPNKALGSQEPPWFNEARDLELKLAAQDVEKPHTTYWNVPCTRIPTHKIYYKYFGGVADRSATDTCAHYASYGYFTGSNELMLAGTDTAYKVWNADNQSPLSDTVVPIPDTGSVIIFSNSKIYIYHNLVENIEPIYDFSPLRLGKIDHYKLRTNPYVTENQVKYSDGAPLTELKANGFSFSNNGRTIVVNQGSHQVFIDVETRLARKFGKNSVAPGRSTSKMNTTISEAGDVAAINNVDFNNYTLYDLKSCVPIQQGKSEECEGRDLTTFFKQKIPNFYNLVLSRFISKNSIELFINVRLDNAELQLDRYILKIPGTGEAKMQYLALGDSFASGEGAYDYRADTDTATNRCHVSSNAYSYLIESTQNFSSTESIACSGALIKDVHNVNDKEYAKEKPQGKNKNEPYHDQEIFTNFLPGYRRQHLFVEEKQPEIITLSIGGNNIDFGRKLRNCIINPFSCYDTAEDRQAILNEIKAQFSDLTKTYDELKRASPNSRIYVIGYPRLVLPDGVCAYNVRLDREELQLAEDITADLNEIIKLASQKSGVFSVDSSNAFEGHRLCEDESWNLAVHGITFGNDRPFLDVGPIGSEAYHPNKLGHVLYKRVIQDQTNYLTAPMPAPNKSVEPNQLSSKLVPLGSPELPSVPRPVNEDAIIDDIVRPGDRLANNLSASGYFFKPGEVYRVEVHSTPTIIGQAVARSTQELALEASLPADLSPGAHTIHIIGNDINGQAIDIYKNVLVIANEADYDGDGILNYKDHCQFIAPAGADADGDGIDDGCDNFIDKPPERTVVSKNTASSAEKINQESYTPVPTINYARNRALSGIYRTLQQQLHDRRSLVEPSGIQKLASAANRKPEKGHAVVFGADVQRSRWNWWAIFGVSAPLAMAGVIRLRRIK